MELHKLVKLITMGKGRSPLTLSILEIATAILVSIVTWSGLHYSLWNLEPFGYYGQGQETFPLWFVNGRQELFSRFAWPMAVILSVSAVSLIRGIRNDVCHFSRLGHFALACR